MSDEEHHFESKADAGASKTYPQQAGTIRKNGYIVIKNRPCKVVEVSTSKTGKHGHAKCHFVGIDIFTAKKLEDIVPSSHNCDVPHVNRTDYQLIDISEDGFVSLLTESGGTKDDLRLPTDENLLTQVKPLRVSCCAMVYCYSLQAPFYWKNQTDAVFISLDVLPYNSIFYNLGVLISFWEQFTK
ncbi:Eukaryotic translation initiation factor 5A-1 isoform 2 [Theobroma cacao]|uniref:Eukaryotic translation initiation factor 5A-1 isoform 2 n=1 Tax=Theobroma cacao TaxID=3641 RepID=A0A061FWM4_THECC|nr:Eukaryotic translation initiation factor 5A-1 isoform 2 [Theobroma cacao]